MTAEQIDDLFAKTLVGDYEDDAPWAAVHELRRMSSREVLDRATEWCVSQEALMRARGVDVLAQIGKTVEHPDHAFPAEAYATISSLLKREKHIRPLDSAIAALGHIGDPMAIPLVMEYQSHPSADIRYAVAFALGSFPNDPRCAESLIILMDDGDNDVRDWATFALGSLSDLDSNEIRDALFARLDDSDEVVREEAIAGLAKRRDKRVLPFLIAALDVPKVTRPIVEAACAMLGIPHDNEDWSTSDYSSALRERFGL
jgi:HEAT repeat protein